MGVTLPVLKNEIIDFFFARLGTGGNYDPTLLFEKRTERIKVYVLYTWGGLYILYAQRCWFIYIFQKHKNGREDSQNRPATSRT